jgi:hypothetical protein
MLLSILRSLYWIPFFGRLLREAIDGPVQALYLFVANLVMSVVLLVAFFGIRALLPVALVGVATMFIVIIDITRDPA